MAKYRNKKNGRIAVMLEEDKKYKTVLLHLIHSRMPLSIFHARVPSESLCRNPPVLH